MRSYTTMTEDLNSSSSSQTTSMGSNTSCNCTGISTEISDNLLVYIIVVASAFIALVTGMALIWLMKYRSLIRTIRRLENPEQLSPPAPEADTLEQNCSAVNTGAVELGQNELYTFVPKRRTAKSASRSLRRPPQTAGQFNKVDLILHQLIKTGREGVFYKAKMMHGTIKGHNTFTCKLSKKGCHRRQVEKEVSVMQKLGTHKNLLQLLDWDITNTPYMLVMEYVAHGTLRTFLQVNKDRLSREKELQQLLTIAAYHIAHAMEHMRSRMIVHCDLALRNILVHSFPHEVKVAEFGLAREFTRTWSRRSSCRKHCKSPIHFRVQPLNLQPQNCMYSLRERIPSRWYPPEYFKNDVYGFKGDVWAFGIVIWEIQTFGTLPYPNLNTSEEVARYVCAGHRNAEPEQCRPEMLQMMKNCWQEPYSLRPSFKDIVGVLENILESDCDYVNLNSEDQKDAVQSEDSHPVLNMEVYCNTEECCSDSNNE